ncbi:hypothetical protein Q7C36_003042 [Tachysurus vachellii]|uniref:Tripartite motif-containing protein 16-like n=1 Tax=Tachysurus vachellii TaxID=175792 RepID=A0AA88NS48_TACVA|nr:hypothetical protein Q7C36_003042 [Tachysurus vachellii]
MAEASISITQEHFSCSICLNLLKEPVTTPCGHSFCMVCINRFWDGQNQKKSYSCPQCRETFAPRPVLRKSNMLTEITDLLKKSDQQSYLINALDIISLESQDAECDSCIGVKEKAVKSCLTCRATYCETHVQPHLESPAFKKHTLIAALSNLQEKMCAEHNKLLEVFCREDKRVICYQCSKENHSDHDTVPVQDEWIEKKKYIEDIQQKHQNRLESREKKLLELKEVTEAYKQSVQEAVEDNKRIFAELLVSFEKRQSEVTEMLRAEEKAELAQTVGVQKQLEQEIAAIKKRQTELGKLSQTNGYIHFLQRFQFLSPKLEISDSFKFTLNHQWSFENFKKSIIQIKEEVEDICKEKVDTFSENGLNFNQVIIIPEPETREEFLKYACELSLDPNTANNYLELSNDNTQVKCGQKSHEYPNHPERFTDWQQVLCKQKVPLRSYWEVEVDGETGVSIAVSYKDISRKGSKSESRFGQNAQSWRLVRYSKKNYCFWHDDTKIEISSPKSKRIGVYLDQKAGILAYYSISDKMNLIHKVTTAFTQPLYAGFGIGSNSFANICLQPSAVKTAVAAAESCSKIKK